MRHLRLKPDPRTTKPSVRENRYRLAIIPWNSKSVESESSPACFGREHGRNKGEFNSFKPADVVNAGSGGSAPVLPEYGGPKL
jgi:hypothetical protein